MVRHTSRRDVKEPTHLSKRGGDVVPGVVVYLSKYGSGGWVRSKNGLMIAGEAEAPYIS